jgi:hypothetical protein
MITLSVITLSGFHCIYFFTLWQSDLAMVFEKIVSKNTSFRLGIKSKVKFDVLTRGGHD